MIKKIENILTFGILMFAGFTLRIFPLKAVRKIAKGAGVFFFI
jgi:hypothetical protein